MIIIIWIVFYLPRALTLNNFRYLILRTLSILQILLLHITVSSLILFITILVISRNIIFKIFYIKIFAKFIIIISIIIIICQQLLYIFAHSIRLSQSK